MAILWGRTHNNTCWFEEKKEHLHISFWWESESDKTNFERNNTYKSPKKTIVWWDHENINTSPPKKNEPKVIRFNSNYFKLEMFLYDERPSLQRAISLHMSTTKPTWVNLLYLNIFTFLIDEKVKVKMPILDLVKYSFVVRCKDLCHIYAMANIWSPCIIQYGITFIWMMNTPRVIQIWTTIHRSVPVFTYFVIDIVFQRI